MDYVFPSSNNENLLVYSNKESNNENLDSNHDHQEEALFGQFHLPFHNEMQSTTSPILQNHHGHHLSTDRSSKTPEKEPDQPPTSPTKPKRVRKKRSAGKKDRHSKIHTAQGLRDRRMRLSLHIARKFFGLQDMLGFDKASKTIEWLFSKSKKAIDEVTQGVNEPQNTTQSVSNERCQSPDLSDCVLDSDIDFNASASNNNKGKQLMFQDADTSSRKPTESDVLARESRDKARARARERTRERMMIINNLEKSKQIFGENPNDDFEQLQLGFSVNPSNNHYYKESSTSSPLEYSSTHHFFEQAQLDHDITQKTEDYLRTTNAASSSSYLSGFGYNKNYANPPAGWLNSSNTFLGFLGGWDSENYGILPNTTASSVTGDIHEQSLSSVIFPPTNLLHFQSQHDQRD